MQLSQIAVLTSSVYMDCVLPNTLTIADCVSLAFRMFPIIIHTDSNIDITRNSSSIEDSRFSSKL